MMILPSFMFRDLFGGRSGKIARAYASNNIRKTVFFKHNREVAHINPKRLSWHKRIPTYSSKIKIPA